MNKYVYILTVILLLCATTVSAESINIVLTSPGDGAEIITYTQDFIFDFDDEPDMINCSLIINEEIEKTRNTLIARNNNKLTVELEAGEHSWYVQCFDSDFNEITSETRSLTVNLEQEITEGYEIIYYSTGLRSYVFTIAPGQEPVELPGILGGEEIRFKLGKNTHYVDIIKMGIYINTSFVDVRDRSSGMIHKVLLKDSIELDFDNNKEVDAKITLDEVERNVKAFFTVAPFPYTGAVEEPEEATESEKDSEPASEMQETEPEEEEEEQVNETEEPTQEPEEETVDEEESQEETEDTESVVASPPEKKNYTWLIILIIVIVIVVIVGIVLIPLKGKKKVKHIKEEKEDKPKLAEELPEETSEPIDVVKSSGRGKKK